MVPLGCPQEFPHGGPLTQVQIAVFAQAGAWPFSLRGPGGEALIFSQGSYFRIQVQRLVK